MSTSHSIHLGFILHYIALTDYCKTHIQMTSIYSTIDVQRENNKVKKMSTSHSIHLGFLLKLYRTYKL